MSQRGARIISPPAAFDIVKAMQTDGLDRRESLASFGHPVGRRRALMEQRTAAAIEADRAAFASARTALLNKRAASVKTLLLQRNG